MSIPLTIAIALAAATAGAFAMSLFASKRIVSAERRAWIAGVSYGAERMRDVAIEALDEVADAAKAPAIPPSDEVAQEMHRRRSL